MALLSEKEYKYSFKENFYKVDKNKIYLFSYLLESMENRGRLVTIDSEKGIVKISFPEAIENEINYLVEYLKSVIYIEEQN